MADFTFKTGDTVPDLELTAEDENGPIDLSTAESIELFLESSTHTLEGLCSKVGEGGAGQLKYVWKEGDTDVAGDYKLEIKIVWSPAHIQSIPNEGTDKVIFEESLL